MKRKSMSTLSDSLRKMKDQLVEYDATVPHTRYFKVRTKSKGFFRCTNTLAPYRSQDKISLTMLGDRYISIKINNIKAMCSIPMEDIADVVRHKFIVIAKPHE